MVSLRGAQETERKREHLKVGERKQTEHGHFGEPYTNKNVLRHSLCRRSVLEASENFEWILNYVEFLKVVTEDRKNIEERVFCRI